MIVCRTKYSVHPVMFIAWHVLVKYARSSDLWPTSQMQRLHSFSGEFPSMMQRVQNHMTGFTTDICQCMYVIHCGVIIPLQMHSVDQSVRARLQDITYQCKVFWIRQLAPLALFGIGLTEAIRPYHVVLVPMSVSDVEGQFDTP